MSRMSKAGLAAAVILGESVALKLSDAQVAVPALSEKNLQAKNLNLFSPPMEGWTSWSNGIMWEELDPDTQRLFSTDIVFDGIKGVDVHGQRPGGFLGGKLQFQSKSKKKNVIRLRAGGRAKDEQLERCATLCTLVPGCHGFVFRKEDGINTARDVKGGDCLPMRPDFRNNGKPLVQAGVDVDAQSLLQIVVTGSIAAGGLGAWAGPIGVFAGSSIGGAAALFKYIVGNGLVKYSPVDLYLMKPNECEIQVNRLVKTHPDIEAQVTADGERNALDVCVLNSQIAGKSRWVTDAVVGGVDAAMNAPYQKGAQRAQELIAGQAKPAKEEEKQAKPVEAKPVEK